MEKLIILLFVFSSFTLNAKEPERKISSTYRFITVKEGRMQRELFSIDIDTCDGVEKKAELKSKNTLFAFNYKCQILAETLHVTIKAEDKLVLSFTTKALDPLSFSVPFKKTHLDIKLN